MAVNKNWLLTVDSGSQATLETQMITLHPKKQISHSLRLDKLYHNPPHNGALLLGMIHSIQLYIILNQSRIHHITQGL